MDFVLLSLRYHFTPFHLIIRDKISDVRKLLSSSLSPKLEESIYREDIHEVHKNDYMVERFLEHHKGNINKTVKGIIYSLQTLKKYRIREINDTDIPYEFWFIGCFLIYETDIDGRGVLYIRAKFFPNYRDVREIFKQLAYYFLWKIQKLTRDKGFIRIFDFEDMSLSQVDVVLAHSRDSYDGDDLNISQLR